ncbi:MAG: helix-turn-helix domain-containing protein [Bacteroidales bacterium]|nr:helix-turn-helix domain-containing protein [Bacteroidales bacterium]
MSTTVLQPKNNIHNINHAYNRPVNPEFEIVSLKTFFKNNNLKKIQKFRCAERNLILIITSGLGKHTIDFKDYQFTNGSVIFIAKGQVHKFEVKPGNNGYLIFFSENFYNKNTIAAAALSQTWLYNYHIGLPQIQVNAEMREHFFDIIKKIHQEYKAGNIFAKTEVIKTLLYLLLIKSERIKRELLNKDVLNRSDIIFDFIDLTENKFSECRNADYYARQLNISYKHLNNICKQSLNKTAKSFIDDHIILVAKRYLVCSDLSVKEITSVTGFDEPTNFVKYFKKHTGNSPMQYRKRFIP